MFILPTTITKTISKVRKETREKNVSICKLILISSCAFNIYPVYIN